MPDAIHSLLSLESSGSAAVALPEVAPAALPAPVLHADIEGAALVRTEQRAGPPPKHIAIGNQRWLLVRACQDLLDRGEASSDAHAVDLVRITRRDEFPDITPSVYSLRRWRKDITGANGRIEWSRREALVPRWATGRRQRDGDARFWPIFSGFYETEEKLSLATAYEYTLMACRRSGIEHVPTISQVRHWYRHSDVRMRAECARRGQEWTRNRVIGHIMRSWDAVAPNDVWIGDHHQFDCMVKVDNGQGGWRAVRPWITAWLDGRSLAIVGWAITTDAPSHRTILEALRNGILLNRMHCASTLMTDRGSDFRMAGFTSPWTSPDAPGVEIASIVDLGCTTRAAKAYNARAKTVERIFGVVCGMYAKLMPSYRGRNPVERPDKANYYSQHPEELPTQGQFVQLFEEWLNRVYHQRPGRGRILRGRSPADVWTPGTGGPILDIQSLRLGLAVPVASPMVRAGGTVVYRGCDWQHQDLWPRIGSKIILRLDPVNSAAFACDLRGRLIGELQLRRVVPALAGGEDLEAELRAQAIHRRALTAAIDEATAGTYGLAAVDRLQIDWSRAVQIERRGQVRSVTGPAHIYRHLAAIQDGRSTSLADDAAPASAAEPAPPPRPKTSRRDAALLEKILSGADHESTVSPAESRRPAASDWDLLADINQGGI